MSYAGDIPPQEAWRVLSEDRGARLVDVRTDAEWAYVGEPDLSSLGKAVLHLSWQLFPAMGVNPHFVEALHEQCPDKDLTLIFLCRSGARSQAAAIAMTELGYKRCFNLASGFEGDLDDTGRRGRQNGWKVDNLPWVQG